MTYREPGAATVLGIVLAPGERVVYCLQRDPSADKKTFTRIAKYSVVVFVAVWIWQIVDVGFADASATLVGAALVWAFVLLGVWAFTPRTPKAQIVTDQRVMVIDHRGRATALPLADATGLRAERTKGYSGTYSNDVIGGVFAVIDAVGQISSAIDNRAAEKRPQVSADYWEHTVAIEVIGRSANMKLMTTEAHTLGPLLARCILEQAADREPAIEHDA